MTDTSAADDATAKRQHAFRPRRGSIKTAVHYSGIGRSSLYDEAGRHPGLFVKWRGKTLVDFDVLDAILDACPPAKIRPLSPAKSPAPRRRK